MQTYKISLLNAVILVLLGLWGYIASESPSVTALIPVGFGILLLVLNPSLKKQNKTLSHLAVVLTLLIAIGLYMPMAGAIERNDTLAILRVSIMMLASLIALIFFIRSFIRVRKEKYNN